MNLIKSNHTSHSSSVEHPTGSSSFPTSFSIPISQVKDIHFLIYFSNYFEKYLHSIVKNLETTVMAFCAITATSSNFALSSNLNEVSVSSTLCTSQSSTRSLSFLKSAAIPLFPNFSLKKINHQHPSLFLTVTASSSPSSSSSTTLAESQGLNVILSSSYILFYFLLFT